MLGSISSISTGITPPIVYENVAMTDIDDQRPSQPTNRNGNYFDMWNASWQHAIGLFPFQHIDRVRVFGTTNGTVVFECGSVNWSVSGDFDQTVELGEEVDGVTFREPGSFRSRFTVLPQRVIN